jgi:Zn-dependent protease with chaperone function
MHRPAGRVHDVPALLGRIRHLKMASLAAEMLLLAAWMVLQSLWARHEALASANCQRALLFHALVALAAYVGILAMLALARRIVEGRLTKDLFVPKAAALAVLEAAANALLILAVLLMIAWPYHVLGTFGLAVTAGVAILLGLFCRLPAAAGQGRGEPGGQELKLQYIKDSLSRFGVAGAEVRLVPFGAELSLAGATRRGERPVVIMDPLLLEQLDERELAVIAAHEAAHLRLGHLRRAAVADVLLYLVMFAAAASFILPLVSSGGPWSVAFLFYLPAMALGLRVVTLALRPVEAAISRRQERRANRWALQATGDPAAFVSAMKKAAEYLGATKPPAWWERWFIASHPSLEEFVAQARRFAQDEGILWEEPTDG